MPVTEYIWDDVNDCVLEETDELGATQATYTHEPAPFGPLVSEYRGGTTSTHHYDALGSTTLLTNDAGTVTDTFQHDAWGNQIARTGTTPSPYTWVGRWGYQDDSANNSGYYIRARSYKPTVARWTSVDPLVELIQFAKYRYGSLSPSQRIDASGLLDLTTWSIVPGTGGTALFGLSVDFCGAYRWTTKFVPNESQGETFGIIVQKVCIPPNINNISICPNSDCKFPDKPDESCVNVNDFWRCPGGCYYELWRVSGSRVFGDKALWFDTPSNQNATQDTDTFIFTGCVKPCSDRGVSSCSKGQLFQRGASFFVSQAELKANPRVLKSLRDAFYRTNDPNQVRDRPDIWIKAACILPSICASDRIDQLFSQIKTSNVIDKAVFRKWDCCCNDPKNPCDCEIGKYEFLPSINYQQTNVFWR